MTDEMKSSFLYRIRNINNRIKLDMALKNNLDSSFRFKHRGRFKRYSEFKVRNIDYLLASDCILVRIVFLDSAPTKIIALKNSIRARQILSSVVSLTG